MQTMTPEVLEHIALPAFLLVPDAQGLPVYAAVNHLWTDGAKLKAHDVVGLNAQQVFPGRFGMDAFDFHKSCMETARPQTYTLPLPMAGALRSAQTRLCPVADKSGRVVQIVGLSQDITDQLLAAETQANAHTLTREIEDFISMAAHDLRTPMRHVALLADMLREDFEDLGDGKMELISHLEDIALKSTELIADILSHAQTTSQARTPEDLSVHALCTRIFGAVDPHSHHLFHCDDIRVLADKAALQITLRNLIDNALKHCGREKVTLDIRVAQSAAGWLAISVGDNGQGFKDPALAFLDGGDLHTDSGFGLLGVRRLIRARGGTISATNRAAGTGSVVHFTLPGCVVTQPPETLGAVQRQA